MSRKSKLPNTKKAAKAYIKWLSGISYVDRILLAGSRSPLKKSKAEKHSDWDFVVVSEKAGLKFAHPRHYGIMHADLIVVSESSASNIPHTVEIYPTDNYKILK